MSDKAFKVIFRVLFGLMFIGLLLIIGTNPESPTFKGISIGTLSLFIPIMFMIRRYNKVLKK